MNKNGWVSCSPMLVIRYYCCQGFLTIILTEADPTRRPCVPYQWYPQS